MARAIEASRYWNKRMAEENVRGNRLAIAFEGVTGAADEMRDAAQALLTCVEVPE